MSTKPSDQVATPAALRHLAAAGLIDAGGLARALELVGGRPTANSWTEYAHRRLLLLGAVLLAIGVIFFVAANWSVISPLQRLGLVAAALIAATIFALLRARADLSGRAAALLAGLLFGPLMAIYGQTYQTGADSWGLFMSWAVVMAGYAIASRFSGAWIAVLALFHLAVLLAWDQLVGGDWEATHRVWVHILLAVADGLLIWALESGWLGPGRPDRGAIALLRTALFSGLSLLTFSALRAVFADAVGLEEWSALACAAVAICALFTVYSRAVPDLFPLVCAAASTCVLLSSALARLLFETFEVDDAYGVLFLGAVICAQVGFAGRWLLSRRRAHRESSEGS